MSLTPQIIPVTKTGGSTPIIQNGSLTDTGSSSGPGDVYTNNFSDYSASSTIVGWTSFTTKQIYTKTIGKIVFVSFYLSGVSNAQTVSFTLPYPSMTSGPLKYSVNGNTTDNGTNTTTGGAIELPGNSSTVTCYKDMSGAANSWTASGTKIVIGQFWYQTV